MYLLSIDSAATAASAALFSWDEKAPEPLSSLKLLGENFLNVGFTHSQTLMPMVEALLQTAGVAPKALGGFAVAAGPGSFTGLRIGIAAVKGMASALNLPCAPVSTLKALAFNAAAFRGLICPVMDARCNQVYTGLFAGDGVYPRRIWDDEAVTLDDLGQKLIDTMHTAPAMSLVLVGDGAELCYNYFRDKLPKLFADDSPKGQGDTPRVFLAPVHLRHQRASSVGMCAAAKWQALAAPADALAPVYLRIPQAERERQKRLETQG